MSVGFGFSAGDFFAALELVTTVVDALRSSSESSAEFRAIVSQLHTLETALLRVKRLEFDDGQQGEVIAVQQAGAQCQRTIDAFWEKIQKYQPHLKEGGSGKRGKDAWMKVKWAVLRKDDLVKFKMNLVGHTESIELLLMTLQLGSMKVESRRNEQYHKTLVGKAQESYSGCMQKIGVLVDRVSTGIQQGKLLLEMTGKIIQTNVQIFQIVLNIQEVITRIPGQVERRQPVYFVDALGREMAFHLEFILSAEALTSVLRSNFKNIGSGAKKIDNGEFAIQDAATKMDIDLTCPWETCFIPGQRAEMSMVYSSSKPWIRCCPKCRKCHDDNEDIAEENRDVECGKCKMIYRRYVEEVKVLEPTPDELDSWVEEISKPLPKDPDGPRPPKRPRDDEEEQEMALFRRVRIRLEIKRAQVLEGDDVTRELMSEWEIERRKRRILEIEEELEAMELADELASEELIELTPDEERELYDSDEDGSKARRREEWNKQRRLERAKEGDEGEFVSPDDHDTIRDSDEDESED